MLFRSCCRGDRSEGDVAVADDPPPLRKPGRSSVGVVGGDPQCDALLALLRRCMVRVRSMRISSSISACTVDLRCSANFSCSRRRRCARRKFSSSARASFSRSVRNSCSICVWASRMMDSCVRSVSAAARWCPSDSIVCSIALSACAACRSASRLPSSVPVLQLLDCSAGVLRGERRPCGCCCSVSCVIVSLLWW